MTAKQNAAWRARRPRPRPADRPPLAPRTTDERRRPAQRTNPKAADPPADALVVDFADDTDGPVRQVLRAGATTDAAHDYWKQIRKVPLLNAEMEVELAKRIEAGLFAEQKVAGSSLTEEARDELEWIAEDGRRAKEHLVEANLRLVVSVARHYAGRGLPLLDLVQEGNLGLIRAVEKFDYTQGHQFSTYAAWWVRQAITRALADQARIIRYPAHVVDEINELDAAERAFTRDHGRPPTDRELLASARLGPERLQAIRSLPQVALAIEVLRDIETQATPLPEHLLEHPEDGWVAGVHNQRLLWKLLTWLTFREREVLDLRFGFDGNGPRTLDEVGQRLGMTRESIRHIESRALTRLREMAQRHRVD